VPLYTTACSSSTGAEQVALHAQHTVTAAAQPARLLAVATTAGDMAAWFPLHVDLDDVPLDRRFAVGESHHVHVRLAGHAFAARVELVAASEHGYELAAHGVLDMVISAEVEPHPRGCAIVARIEVRGRGLRGRILETAARPLIGPGLHRALDELCVLAETREREAVR
jgi:Polyketide cyclase / dehydrase and lipid transport